MDSDDLYFDPEMLIPDWICSTDWDSTLWKNQFGKTVDVTTIESRYARNLLRYIKRNFDELNRYGLNLSFNIFSDSTLIRTLERRSENYAYQDDRDGTSAS
jgi:hypothetical protein